MSLNEYYNLRDQLESGIKQLLAHDDLVSVFDNLNRSQKEKLLRVSFEAVLELAKQGPTENPLHRLLRKML